MLGQGEAGYAKLLGKAKMIHGMIIMQIYVPSPLMRVSRDYSLSSSWYREGDTITMAISLVRHDPSLLFLGGLHTCSFNL